MRLALIDNFIMPDGGDPSFFDVHPHLGLISLAAVAMQENHVVTIYDPKREVRFKRRKYDSELYLHAADDILGWKPEAVGFTTLGCSFLFAVNVARIIKQREPGIPILLGGPHATMLDQRILETYDYFDVVVRHEAEEIFPALLAKLETRAFLKIPGVTWRDGHTKSIRSTAGKPKIDVLDSLPIPAYDLYPIDELGLDLMRVEAGRGCPFSCTFCSTALFFHRDYRLKSAERIVAEMDMLHERYGFIDFKLDHDLFTVNRRKIKEFCETVQHRNYRWRASARTDCVDQELLESMALAGCVGLYFGIETGSTRMQVIADKRLKLSGVERILDVAENLGIEATTSFITGYPEETQEDQDDTLDLLGKCFRRSEHACIPQLHILVPEPGTPLFAKHSQALAYDGYTTKFNARLLRSTDLNHVLSYPELYSTYYYYPVVMPRSAYTFAVDAVDALRSVGHEILSYALRFYDGQMSTLIRNLKDWLSSNRPNMAVDAHLVLDFISDSFGAEHHLTSLFRYGVSINIGRFSDLAHRQLSAFKDTSLPKARYQLYPGACFFEDIHNCDDLLTLIRGNTDRDKPLDVAEVGQTDCYLSIIRDNTVSNYRVDRDIEVILDLFREPRSLVEIAVTLRSISNDEPLADDFFEGLIEIGALTEAIS